MGEDVKEEDIVVEDHESIKETEWLSLKRCYTRVEGDDDREAPYIYAEETCTRDGIVVSVLPFRRPSQSECEFLLRKEHTPPWGDGLQISTLTGKVDDREHPGRTAVRELYEESGYHVPDHEEIVRSNHDSGDVLIGLGQVFSNKAMNTRHFLYAVDLTGVPRTEDPSGDGTLHEDLSGCVWKSSVRESVDPLAYTSYFKLQDGGYL